MSRPPPPLRRLYHCRLPTTPLCPRPVPLPLCPCAPTPPGLDIDTRTPLADTAPHYTQHLLLGTSRTDWAPRIEADASVPLAARLKAAARDPAAPVLVTAASFRGAGVWVLPAGWYVPRVEVGVGVGGSEGVGVEAVRGLLTGAPSAAAVAAAGARRVNETVVLICTHTARDERCGVLGALLKAQFEAVLRRRGVLLSDNPDDGQQREEGVRVAGTSHLSGHKWAGNVIVYLPARGEGKDAGDRGVGVWYGRVETRHVEGIVQETVFGRRVVGELCRGVVGGVGGRG